MKATVKRNDEQQGNIFRQGNLVASKHAETVILVTVDKPESERFIFKGVVVASDGTWSEGKYSEAWEIDAFKLFSGSVLLEQ